MKFVIQRVKNASVTIDEKLHSSIGKGLLVFFCAQKGDEEGIEAGGKKLNLDETLEWYKNKILKLRIFEDESGKMNRSVLDIQGEILVVSQFTLAANCKKGTRPSFDSAMEPAMAKKFYEDFVSKLKQSVKNADIPQNSEIKQPSGMQNSTQNEQFCGLKSVQTGIFAADMKISLINDGPVTIILP